MSDDPDTNTGTEVVDWSDTDDSGYSWENRDLHDVEALEDSIQSGVTNQENNSTWGAHSTRRGLVINGAAVDGSSINEFDSKRLIRVTDLKAEDRMHNFVDFTDAYANTGMTLDFLYVPTGQYVKFKAYITALNETYSSDWSQEEGLGRVDGFYAFKQTQRSVSLGFSVIGATSSEVYENLYRLDLLRSMLYPKYSGNGANALTIEEGPLLRLRVHPMLSEGAGSPLTYDQMFGNQSALDAVDIGNRMAALHGVLLSPSSLTYDFNLGADSGVLAPGTAPTSKMGIMPKVITVSLDFVVLNSTFFNANLNWGAGGQGAFRGAPDGHPAMRYGVDLPGSANWANGMIGTEGAIDQFTEAGTTPAADELSSESEEVDDVDRQAALQQFRSTVEEAGSQRRAAAQARQDARRARRARWWWDVRFEAALDNMDEERMSALYDELMGSEIGTGAGADNLNPWEDHPEGFDGWAADQWAANEARRGGE